jgi:transposase-like protein
MSQLPDLTTIQLEVLASISAGSTATAAAQQAGVHRNTVANWLRSTEFRSALFRARAEKSLLYQDQAEALAAEAVNGLRRMMQDMNLPAMVRLRATIALLDHAAFRLPQPGAVVPLLADQSPIHETVHNDAQCAFAANLGVVNATFSRYTCEREFPIPLQDNIRRTPCKRLSRNTRTRFKAR